MFDAYTVKKVLPRLVIAVILIQLSWFLFTGMITLTNAVAYGVEALIYAPFGSPQQFELQNVLSAADGGIGISIVIAGGAGLAMIGVALSLVGTALLAMLIGFALLMFRQVLVIALLVVSPLALVAWILPNTEKFWKLWWESFSKLLLVYPLILGTIAIGRVFAYISAEVRPGGQASNPFTAVGFDNIIGVCFIIIGFFGPFFFIPKLFSIAGGAFSTITGMVNDRGRGAFDRLKKGRQAKRAQQWEDTKSGNLLKGSNAFSRRVSSAAQTATLLGAAGLRPRRMRANIATARSSRNYDNAVEFADKNAAFQALKNDDDKLWALMEGTDEASIRASLRKHGGARFADPNVMNAAVAEVMRVKREGGDAVTRIAATRAQAATGTGFDSVGEMLDEINRVSGGDRTVAGRLLGDMRTPALQSGRVDLGAAGFADMAIAMEKRRKALAGGTQYSRADATEEILESVIDSSASGQAIFGKPKSAEQIGHTHVKRLQRIANGVVSGAVNPQTGQAYTQRDLDQALASTMGIYDAMGSAPPQIARAFADTMTGAQVINPLTGQPMTVLDLASHISQNSPDFAEMRRDYQSGYMAQAAAGQAQAAQGMGNLPAPAGGLPPAPGQPPWSDRRLKCNIVYLKSWQSIRLYRFQYIWSDVEYVGVMAQDLLDSHSYAVIKGSDGYYRVDYEALGLEMMEYNTWRKNQFAKVLAIH